MKTTKTKNLLLGIAIGIGTSFAIVAQNVPNYVPTNGLVGWWPFNGNANDESGNNNNGTVNGASLTIDRNGNVGKAYSFDGVSNEISVPSSNQLNILPITISAWFKTSSSALIAPIVNKYPCFSYNGYSLHLRNGQASVYYLGSNSNITSNYLSYDPISSSTYINDNVWHNLTYSVDQAGVIYYLDGTLLFNGPFNNGTGMATNTIEPLHFGMYPNGACSNTFFFEGNIDDIGIWNRVLTQQEISDLYNAVNCNLIISLQNNTLQIGNTAVFNATTSDPNPNYIWQSDLGQGFQTLNNYGNYSGVNTNTLSIANIQLANHNQPIRAISTSGNCVDTSNVAYINIADTCITTVYDTVITYISVTDTLFINVNTVGLNNNTIINTIKVYPNPAKSHLNLDFGNFNSLNGYSIKIYNSLSQVIYNQQITQQSETIDLSTFGGNGVYFLHVINAQNNTVEIRKIVLQ